MNLKEDKEGGFGIKSYIQLKYEKNVVNCLIIFVGVLLIIFVGYSMVFHEALKCGDGTAYGECSMRKPYFCKEGSLVENAPVCGCSNLSVASQTFLLYVPDYSCKFKYKTNPKNITLKYVLRGQEGRINFVVYGGLADYLSGLPRSISYEGDNKPSRADFKFRNLDDEWQRELLLPLVTEIQNLEVSDTDKMRIAVSLVQKIPYGESEKRGDLIDKSFSYSRYPYEVLYDMEGVCGEKSELLAFLLREMGYGVAFFYHQEENHESIGIKCPKIFSLDNTGYCFIETTGPSIITDNKIIYADSGKLESEPEVIPISEGDSLGWNLYEYDDAKDLIKLKEKGVSMFSSGKFDELKEKYDLVGMYRGG